MVLVAREYVEYGVVFVCDPTSKIDVPDRTDLSLIRSTSNCISVWTQHEVDGPTDLIMGRWRADELPFGLTCVFRQQLIFGNCVACLTDANGIVFLRAKTEISSCNVSVLVDDTIRPKLIHVSVEGLLDGA